MKKKGEEDKKYKRREVKINLHLSRDRFKSLVSKNLSQVIQKERKK